MIKSRIIVTGATGKTGSVVVAELLKAGYPGRGAVILFGGVCPRKGGVKNLLCKITNVIFGEDYANLKSSKSLVSQKRDTLTVFRIRALRPSSHSTVQYGGWEACRVSL